MSDDVYLASWCNEGLEYLVNLTNEEKSYLFKVLSGEKPDYKSWLQQTVTGLTMRARYNTQRHYEIYSFRVDSTVKEDSIREMFNEAPQTMVDLIREKGVKVYSDRAQQDTIKIV